jgi:ABC-type glycerol-3-phosphate transport system permease component/peptidoglycan/LPS O-acetylase OafA/YrhL
MISPITTDLKPPVKHKSRPKNQALLFIAPFFLLLLMFAFAPLFLSLVVSLMEWNPSSGLSKMRFDGLWAFDYTIKDPIFWQGLWRSLRVALFTAVGQHVVAIPLAFCLHIAFKRVQGSVAALLFMPFMTSSLAVAALLGSIFAAFWAFPLQINDWLSSLPLVGALVPNLSQLSDEASAAFSQLWGITGWNVLLYLMVLNIVPRSLYEAAQLDGANFWRLFWHVALPIMRPMIFVAATMSFLRGTQTSIGNWFGQINDIRNIDLPTYIIRTAFWDFDFGLASAQTWLFFAGIAVVVMVFYWLFGRNFTTLETTALNEADSSPLRFSSTWRIVMKFMLFAALTLAVLPMLHLLLSSTQSYQGRWFGFGDALAGNYTLLLENQPNFWHNIWNSSYIALLATIGAVVISSLAAFAFALLDFRHKGPLYAIVLAVMLFPSLMNLIPTALNMAVLGWIDQARAVWVPGMVSAFGVFLLRQYAQSAVPKSLLEAARIDGASDGRIYWQIMLPLARPALATLGLITFVTVWNNNSVALALLKDPDHQMISQILAYMQANGNSNYRMAAALANLVPLLAFLVCAGQIRLALNLETGSNRLPWWQMAWQRLTTIWQRPAVTALAAPASVVSTLAGADGVRAIACLMVIFHHLWQRFDTSHAGQPLQTLDGFFEQGNAGVSAFFVLSGLLLSIPFWKAYLAQKALPNMLEYVRRRALRIVPGFYASLLVCFLLALFFVPNGEKVWLRLLSGLSFTSAFHYVTLFPVEMNGPLWSIGFEVFCYMLMPLGMWLLFAKFPGRSFGFGVMFWLSMLALVLVANQLIVEGLVPDNVQRSWEYGLIGGAKTWMPNYNAVGMFAHYLIGVLAAGFIVDRQRRSREPSLAFDALALLAFVGMLAILWFGRGTPEYAASFQAQPYRYPWFPLSIAIMLVSLPFSRHLGRLFDNAFLRFTARVSFGLYIWHFPILELIQMLHNENFRYAGIQNPLEFLWLSTLALGLAYSAASLSYRHIEAPFLPAPSAPSTPPIAAVPLRSEMSTAKA